MNARHFVEARRLRLPALVLALWMALIGSGSLRAYDVPGFTPDQIVEYKQTTNSTGGAVNLDLHVFTPPGHRPGHQRSAIIFFFGGGWSSGSTSHFHPHCEYFASRGMVAISADYRVSSVHGTTPRECVKDGKSAIRYVREHAAELGVDPNRIAAGGGSAGGHVAAAAGTLTSYEELGENLSIRSRPDALVLFNPVIDNGPGGYGYSTVQDYWQNISPIHNIDSNAPPTTFFLGTSDALIPVATAESYKGLMEAEGLRCDLHLYEGQAHGFFNYDVPDDGKGPYYGYRATVFLADEFLVSLGYLEPPHDAPNPVTGWVTIYGDAGFLGGSEATASPLTTDADMDGIAANFSPLTLADGDFVRAMGTVSIDAPLTGANFRFGVFAGDDPVTAGDGTGYSGIWAGAPATVDTSIAAGDGSGTTPFDSGASTSLGPMRAAASTLPAGTPFDFALMIARNGDSLDVSARFSDGGAYDTSQNLLNVGIADFDYNSVAFLMTGNLNGTSAVFSNVVFESGQALPSVDAGSPSEGDITYVDAVEGASGNTFATGGALTNTTWVGPDSSSANNTQWNKRLGVEGNGGTLYHGAVTADTLPELTTEVAGLADGLYRIWAFYWDQVDSDSQNWILSAGLQSGVLTRYSSPGEPGVTGATTAGVVNAADLSFTTNVQVEAGFNGSIYLRNLFGVDLGTVTVSNGAMVNVYVDNDLTSGTGNRAWYDGVGYQPVSSVLETPLLGVDFNRDDALGSPSQSGFRVVSGSAANQASNAPVYAKTIDTCQVFVSQPDGTNLEFRGANGDSSRVIPGGDTSLSYLVSDFIATREGAIDIEFSGLAAGNYRFRSWHLDTLEGSTLGFAQGTNATSPNLIEGRVGGLTRDSVEPTALGPAGLNATFIDDSQIPSLDFWFSHDGVSPSIIQLRAIDSNGGDRFLLLNGFRLYEVTP